MLPDVLFAYLHVSLETFINLQKLEKILIINIFKIFKIAYEL